MFLQKSKQLTYSHFLPYLVIYQKPNGEIIFRLLKHLFLDIGETNNSGWKVISIQKYIYETQKFQEIIPFYSSRYQHEKSKERVKQRKGLRGKISRIIEIIKE